MNPQNKSIKLTNYVNKLNKYKKTFSKFNKFDIIDNGNLFLVLIGGIYFNEI
jgi:hypothetical protein